MFNTSRLDNSSGFETGLRILQGSCDLNHLAEVSVILQEVLL